LFLRQLVGLLLQDLLKVALDLKGLSRVPRQVGAVTDRVTSETLQWNVVLAGLNPKAPLDSSANHLSFSVVVKYADYGAATIFAQTPAINFSLGHGVLFLNASLFNQWLLISILRNGHCDS